MSKYAVAIIFCYLMIAWLGCKKDTTRFFPIAPSGGDTTTLRGIASIERGDSAYNSVFLDLSKEGQTSVLRSSWDLGFYCGTDFRVIINHAIGATVAELSAVTNLNAVTAADTSALVNRLTLNDTQGDITTVDPVEGDAKAYLAGTAIKEVPAAAADSRVYILNRGSATNLRNRKWIKMLITRRSSGYFVTWGNISDNDGLYSTFAVTKDASFNFKYTSFTNGGVTYEPAKTLWDISWGLSTYKAAAANTDGTVRPQPQADFMLINFMNGVTAAQVLLDAADTTKNFRNFNASKLTGITFSGNRDVIGASWRNLANSTTGALAINVDRFYLVKDLEGNIYKVSFAGGGSRGTPIVEYILVQAAAVTTPN
jgi:hypothetical protein